MRTPQRGDIWWIRLDPTQGSEIRKTRPCIIVSNDIANRHRHTVVIVPLSTSAKAHPPIMVAVRCQNKDSVAVLDQIRAVGKHRLLTYIESASENTMDNVSLALAKTLVLTGY